MVSYDDVVSGRLLLHARALSPEGLWSALADVAAAQRQGTSRSLAEVLARRLTAVPGGREALGRARRSVPLVLAAERARVAVRVAHAMAVADPAALRARYQELQREGFPEPLEARLGLNATDLSELRGRVEPLLEQARLERRRAVDRLAQGLAERFGPEEAKRIESAFQLADVRPDGVGKPIPSGVSPTATLEGAPPPPPPPPGARNAVHEPSHRAALLPAGVGQAIPTGGGQALARPTIQQPLASSPGAPPRVDGERAAEAPAAPRPRVVDKAEALAAASGGPAPLVPEECPIYGYEILRELGKGAMGVVYQARHLLSGQVTALKVLPLKLAAKTQYLERFKREAMALMRLRHENIVAALDFGGSEEYYYLALEFVDGTDLEGVLEREGRLPERRALEITAQIARGLAAAAEHGVIHRDIKPENVMLTPDGVAKIMDFGIVKLTDLEESGVTLAGTTVGTPFYISPEQARGEEDLDSRSDIYSLGITLFHLTTGRVPFEGRSQGAILVRHILEEVPDPRSLRPELSADLARVVQRMTRKRPEDRYASGVAVAEDIASVLARGGR